MQGERRTWKALAMETETIPSREEVRRKIFHRASELLEKIEEDARAVFLVRKVNSPDEAVQCHCHVKRTGGLSFEFRPVDRKNSRRFITDCFTRNQRQRGNDCFTRFVIFLIED